VVIAGEAQHVVVRLSRGTVTNLHISNTRTNLEALLARMDRRVWDAARQTCEQAMKLFPGALYAGVDLLITSDLKRHAIAEVNAFGDLLYGAVHNGLDPYQAEIVAACGGRLGTGSLWN
jgi:glutathione synthase/RimK-type ligase-like ATP-grasp enzyme